MKISKYTFFFDIDNKEFYLYNSISNALIEIDKDSYQTLINKEREKANLSSFELDNELYDVLKFKRAVRILKKVEVSQMQITLDGLKNTHNKIKYTQDCNDVFSRVMDNIELILSTSDIHVVIRVNLTKQNEHEYVELYNEILKRLRGYKKFGISPEGAQRIFGIFVLLRMMYNTNF